MMDELIDKVSEKTGLSPEQTKAAVEAVLGVLKEKLPTPLAGALDSLLGGAESGGDHNDEGLASKATAALGNLFGKSS